MLQLFILFIISFSSPLLASDGSPSFSPTLQNGIYRITDGFPTQVKISVNRQDMTNNIYNLSYEGYPQVNIETKNNGIAFAGGMLGTILIPLAVGSLMRDESKGLPLLAIGVAAAGIGAQSATRFTDYAGVVGISTCFGIILVGIKVLTSSILGFN